MEFVDGVTLSAWATPARDWRETLAVLVDAIAGVAAAHAAGLVHRDIKPSNIMVGEDGRVRVMDFGVVRGSLTRSEPSIGPHTKPTASSEYPAAVVPPELSAVMSAGLSASGLRSIGAEHTMTRDGRVIGTPAYMAPEQHRGPSDARSDQFSLCATAWHVLYGSLPYPGDDATSLASAVIDGRRRPPPSDTKVPRWVRRIVERGLAHDPAKRWPDLVAMTRALEAGSRAADRRPWVLGTVAVVLAGGGLWTADTLDARRRSEACEQAGQDAGEVWPGLDGGAAQDVRAALEATGMANADASFATIDQALRDWADQWQGSKREACRAELEGRWNADLRSQAEACLDESRLSVQEAVRAYGSLVEWKVTTNMGYLLSGVEARRCVDPLSLRVRPAPPESDLDAVTDVRRSIARADASRETGQALEVWAAQAEEAMAAAVELGWPPLLARAGSLLGVAHLLRNDIDAAEREFIAAFRHATQGGDPGQGFHIATQLASTLAPREGRSGEALVWLEAADAQRAQLAEDNVHADARRLIAEASARGAMGQLDRAVAALEAALALVQPRAGLDADRHKIHDRLAQLLHRRGEAERALEHLDQARGVLESMIGPQSREVADNINNRATVLFASGDLLGARAGFEEALALRETLFGRASMPVAHSLSNLAAVCTEEGRVEEAVLLLEEALETSERIVGPDNPQLIGILLNLGVARLHTSKAAPGVQRAGHLVERALAISTDSFGKHGPLRIDILDVLAEVRRRQGRPDDARPLLEAGLEQCVATHGPGAQPCAELRTSLGVVAASAEDWAVAEHAFGEVVRSLEGSPESADVLCSAKFELAKVLVASGGDSARARTLAQEALQEARRLVGEPGVPDPDAIGQWLATLP